MKQWHLSPVMTRASDSGLAFADVSFFRHCKDKTDTDHLIRNVFLTENSSVV